MTLASQCDLSLTALVLEQANLQADAPAILAPGRLPLSYAGLWQQMSELAETLHQFGVTRKTRVAVVLPNGPEMAVAFLGTAACAVCAPMNPAYHEAELRFYLQDIGVQVVIVGVGERGPVINVAKELGLSVVAIQPDVMLPAGRFRMATDSSSCTTPVQSPASQDIALILHTSGTTSRPKIVPLSHSNLVASARNIAQHLALSPDDCCLNVMPLFHIHGLLGALLASVAGGGSVVCTPGFDENEFFDWTAQFNPTWYTAVPTIHQSVVTNGALYRPKAPNHHFRFVRSSSSALPPKLFGQLRDLTGAPVIEAYGMTEASHQMASNSLPPGRSKPGSVGLARGVDIALMDDAGHFVERGSPGEIVVRGPGVSAGYENNPQANAQSFVNGWFRTGDKGWFDEDGYLFISGRLKEIVNRGGEKISPREIDEALLEHADVSQAIAFAVPHPTLGEDLAAAVVLRRGAQVGEQDLRSFLFDRIAGFKVPSSIIFIDAIPKGATGKVQRTSLYDKIGHQIDKTFVAPRTELESSIERIFHEVLGCDVLSVHDNFFALGGDSLMGTQVVARVNALYELELAVPVLFKYPSISLLALEIESVKMTSIDVSDELTAEISAMSDEEVARLLVEERSSL